MDGTCITHQGEEKYLQNFCLSMSR